VPDSCQVRRSLSGTNGEWRAVGRCSRRSLDWQSADFVRAPLAVWGSGVRVPRLHNSYQCAKSCSGRVGRGFGWPFVVGGDHEDGDEVGALDFNLGDVGFDDRFALAGGAGGDDVGQVAAELFDRCGAGRARLGVDEFGEVVVADAELVEFGGEVADAVAAGAFVEGAVFERR
jgi:hypothetical protein